MIISPTPECKFVSYCSCTESYSWQGWKCSPLSLCCSVSPQLTLVCLTPKHFSETDMITWLSLKQYSCGQNGKRLEGNVGNWETMCHPEVCVEEDFFLSDSVLCVYSVPRKAVTSFSEYILCSLIYQSCRMDFVIQVNKFARSLLCKIILATDIFQQVCSQNVFDKLKATIWTGIC
jgi:hypothetical protein